MIDLRISYINSCGAATFREYQTIMDFTEEFESNTFEEDATWIKAVFFEKVSRTKYFNTLSELYNFCREILK